MKKVRILFLLLFISCLASPLFAQNRVIKGRITSSEDGSALPGVNVAIKGTNVGASTNSEGNYSLSVPAEYAKGTLVFSFIGMKPTEMPISSSPK